MTRIIEVTDDFKFDKISGDYIFREDLNKYNKEKCLKYVLGRHGSIFIEKPKILLDNWWQDETLQIHGFKKEKEYDTLMQIMESGGWSYKNYYPTDVPINKEISLDKLAIRVNKFYKTLSQAKYKEDKCYFADMIPKEFYFSQKITPKIINEINEWVEKNYQNRPSKRGW